MTGLGNTTAYLYEDGPSASCVMGATITMSFNAANTEDVMAQVKDFCRKHDLKLDWVEHCGEAVA